MAYEDARMRAARLFREAVTRDPSLYKEFAPKFQTVGLDISMGAPKGWTLPTAAYMHDAEPSPFGDRNLPRPRPDMPPGFTAADDPYLARQNMPPPASGLAPDAPFMANPAVAAGSMQPASSLYPGFAQAPERERATGWSSFSGLTRRRLDANALAPLQQVSAAGPPSPLTGAGPPSSLAQPGGPSPLPGVGPPAPIIGREAPPGLNGPLSPLASRFGDQSQIPGGAFSGSLPRPPQPRPFESMIAGRPMPPGGPGSLPAAPLLAGKPFPSAPGMASRFGDQSQLASGAFSGGPPPPTAGGPTPQQLAAAKDQVQQIAALRSAGALTPASPPSPLMPLETTPTSTMPNPLQRQPLDLAAGVGAPRLPLGSTNLPFATDTPASVDQRTAAILGPRPPGVGTGLPSRTAQAPLISVPPAAGTAPVGPVTSQDLSPPVGVPPSLASVGPPNPARMEVVANYNQPPPGMGDRPFPGAPPTPPPAPAAPAQQPAPYGRGAGRLAGTLLGVGAGLASGSLPAAIVEGGLGYKVGGYLGRKAGQLVNPNAPPPLDASGVPAITPPVDIPMTSTQGGIFGQGVRGMGRQMQRAIAAVASGKMSPEAASKAFGVPKDSLHDGLSSTGSAGRGGMGGWGGSGGWGGGSSYTGGQYGGNAGGNINAGVGQRFGQR